MAKKQSSNKPEDPLSTVLDAIATIEKAHAIGCTVREKFGERAPSGKIAEAAKEYGYPEDAIRKLRQFATLYDEDDLAELCDLCRKHLRAFGISLIYKLVSIQSKTERKKLQRRAIIGHWGYKQLARELRRSSQSDRKPSYRRGRKHRFPETIPEAVAEIEETRERFIALLKHCHEMTAGTKAIQGEQRDFRQLRAQVRRLLEALGVEMLPVSGRSRKS